jgi:hypothetical protein
LTTLTPSCSNYEKPIISGCFYCNFTLENINTCKDNESFNGLFECTNSTELQSKSNWVECEGYNFDRSINPNLYTSFYHKGDLWETAVTQERFNKSFYKITICSFLIGHSNIRTRKNSKCFQFIEFFIKN